MVGGPTACGKSALALAIAEKFGGIVINADSMQIYRDLPIITARPSAADADRAPHRLYGILDAAGRFSAGEWRSLALDAIAEASAEGRLPIVVGGTGLYLKALTGGLHAIPPVPAAVRRALTADLERDGPERLHAELSAVDPESAARLAPADSQRIIRALEVLRHTGRGIADWHRDSTAGPPAGFRFLNIVFRPARDELYAACGRRFVAMLAAGAADELRAFVASGPPPGCPLWKAVGVAPLRRYLAGEIDEAEMIAQGQRDTRRYAKRQLTWFRHQIVSEMDIETKFMDINFDEIFSKISIF